MKKVGLILILVAFMAGPAVHEAAAQRGGIGGFLVGCCFGVRTAGAFNEGKDIHFREWGLLIPYANIVFIVWNGADGMGGMTTSRLQQKYGATFF